MLFLDDPVVSNFLFYPRKLGIPHKLPRDVQALKFITNDNILIGGYFVTKRPSNPTLLVFHGNAEIAYDYLSFLSLYDNLPLNLAFVDYRGYGHSSGTPSITYLIEDAKFIYNALTNWLEERNLNNNVVIKGRSLGSICVSEIGQINPVNLAGIIFESGFSNLHRMATRWFGSLPFREEDVSAYSNDTKIQHIKKSSLVMHGTEDQIIPYSEGVDIYKNLPDSIYKKLVTFEGVGHNDIFHHKRKYNKNLRDFMVKLEIDG